jgi:hypothetical protein
VTNINLGAFEGGVLIKAAKKPHLQVFDRLVSLLSDGQRPEILCGALMSHGESLPPNIFTLVIHAVGSVPTGISHQRCRRLLPHLVSTGRDDLARKFIKKGMTWDQELVTGNDKSVLYIVLPKLLESTKDIKDVWSNHYWYPGVLTPEQIKTLVENAMKTATLLDDSYTFEQLCRLGVNPSGQVLSAVFYIQAHGDGILKVAAIRRIANIIDFGDDVSTAWECLKYSLDLMYFDIAEIIKTAISKMEITGASRYHSMLIEFIRNRAFLYEIRALNSAGRSSTNNDKRFWFLLSLMDPRIPEKDVREFRPLDICPPEYYALALQFGRTKIAREIEEECDKDDGEWLEAAMKQAETQNFKVARWLITGKLTKNHALRRSHGRGHVYSRYMQFGENGANMFEPWQQQGRTVSAPFEPARLLGHSAPMDQYARAVSDAPDYLMGTSHMPPLRHSTLY